MSAIGDSVELTATDYDALVEAAETYRAALVVRLAGEAGLRTAEVTRVRPRDVRRANGDPERYLLAVPDGEGSTDRLTCLPASLAAELRRYAASAGVADDDAYVDVSPRRVQMLVSETGGRAAEATGDESLAAVTPRALRQRFARALLVDRGVDPRVVRAVGGWETLDALEPYLEPPDEAEVLAAIAGEPDRVEGTAAGVGWLARFELDADGRVRAWSAGARSLAGHRAEEISGRPLSALYAATEPDGAADDDLRTARDRGRHSVVRWVSRADGTPIRARLEFDAGEARTAVLLADLREAADGETSAPGVDAALDAVVASGSREELLAAVPERLAASPRWEFAWVAGRDRPPAGEVAEPVAGVAPPAFREPESRVGDAPWGRALEEGEPAYADEFDVGTGAERPVAAVPLSHLEATYGALCVVAAGCRPPDAGERRALAALGEGVGRTITSFRWRDLLHSDAVLELEFRTSDERAFLPRVSARLDCDVRLDSTVSVSDAALLYYVTVDGASPGDVADIADETPGIDETRVVETRDDGCALSVLVEGSSPVRVLTEHGAAIREAVAEAGELRVVADVPTGTDVRPLVDGLRASFPDARLVGKRALDRPPSTRASLRAGVGDRLTERQRTALDAAYHGGYFDWPRGSTAEEVADAMGVSPPTFHNHLRKAQRGILDALFEESNATRR